MATVIMNGVESHHFANKVYLADSRRMPEIPDESIRLIVTSPPYFNIKDYSLDGHQQVAHSTSNAQQLGDISNFDHFIEELVSVWKESFRTLLPNGKLVINVPLMPMLKKEFSTHENRHIFDLNSAIQQSILNNIPGLYLMDTYIWSRTNTAKSLMFGSYPYPTNFYAQNTTEFVTVYVKEGKAIRPSAAIKEASKLTQEEWVEYTKQIWSIPIPNRGDLAFGTHAALMPETLAERCIRLFSFVDDVVLDPFTGSGTTLRVAKRLGRNFVGYEIMESYKEIIEVKVAPGVCTTPQRGKVQFAEVSIINEVPSNLMNKIHQGDYSKLLWKIPINSIDLVCVDPPYNLKKAEWDTFASHGEFLEFTRKWIDLVTPKIKDGGSFYVFNTPRNCAYILPYLESIGYEYQNWITWNKKDGFTSTKKKFLPEQESILYVTKGNFVRTFNAESVRIPYESTERIAAAKTKGILKNGKRWYPNENGRLCPDVWQIPSERHSTKRAGKIVAPVHPTVKPLSLMERIIRASSNPGDIVLDFFAGTGSTLVAAKINDRNYLGCDANAEYVKLARQRLKLEERL